MGGDKGEGAGCAAVRHVRFASFRTSKTESLIPVVAPRVVALGEPELLVLADRVAPRALGDDLEPRATQTVARAVMCTDRSLPRRSRAR